MNRYELARLNRVFFGRPYLTFLDWKNNVTRRISKVLSTIGKWSKENIVTIRVFVLSFIFFFGVFIGLSGETINLYLPKVVKMIVACGAAIGFLTYEVFSDDIYKAVIKTFEILKRINHEKTGNYSKD